MGIKPFLENNRPEADKAAGTGDAPAETTASPATQAPAPSQSETKNTVVETPATTAEKSSRNREVYEEVGNTGSGLED